MVDATIELLSLWGQIHGFQVSTVQSIPGMRLGEWSRMADDWVLPVTEELNYKFTHLGNDTQLREALALTILGQKKLELMKIKTVQETTLSDLFTQAWQLLLSLTNEERYDIALHREAIYVMDRHADFKQLVDVFHSQNPVTEDGYFFLVRPDGSSHVNKSPEVHEAVEEVACEFLHAAWGTWFSMREEQKALILFVPTKEFNDLFQEREDEGEERRLSEWLHEVAANLANTIAQDALTACRLTIAAVGAGETIGGLCALVYTDVMQNHLSHRIVARAQSQHAVFGLYPLAEWLFALPNEWKARFVGSITRDQSLINSSRLIDLQDTLDGLVQANLNASEAARLLYIHRNTLNHRIEKIRSQTGFDVRQFTDALVLYVVTQMGILAP
jgi:PucR C-terminal helix-turn-helix domain